MKKIFVLLLSVVLLLSACAEGAGKKQAENSQKQTAETKTEAKPTTVGFIYVGPVGDGGYTYAHDQGRLYLEKELGDKVKTIYKESVEETLPAVEAEIRNMVDQGATIIFTTSFGFMEGTKKAAAEFPNVTFFHCSGYEKADNMSNYFGRIYQARYLTGIVAGLKTKANSIGYVGAFPIPEVVRGINAFTLGAQSVNPEVKVKVVWTNTWYDPAKEKEAAISLLDAGVDIISQHQDTAGPQQAAEERGAFAIGYNTDMSAAAPKANLTSAVWNWGPYYVREVNAVLNGQFKSEAYWGGFNDNIVDISPLTANAPEAAKAKVEEAKMQIKDGKLKVFAGPIYDQAGELKVKEGEEMSDEELLNFNWFVKGVEGKIE